MDSVLEERLYHMVSELQEKEHNILGNLRILSQILHELILGPRKMSPNRQHNLVSLKWEYFPPDIDDIDSSVLRCLLESNEPTVLPGEVFFLDLDFFSFAYILKNMCRMTLIFFRA